MGKSGQGQTGHVAVVVVWCTLLSVFPYGVSQTQVCQYYENQTISTSQPYTELQVVVNINSNAVSGSGANATIYPSLIEYISFESTLSSPSSPAIVVKRTVEMMDASATPPLIRLTTSLTHTSSSTASGLSGVDIEEDISNGLQAYWTSSFTPGYSASGVSVSGRHFIKYTVPATLTPGNNATVKYEAEPSGDQGTDLSSGITDFIAYLSFTDVTSATSFGPFSLPVCLDTTYIYESSIIYEHGFTALSFFIALLVGCVLVVVGVFLCFFVCRCCKRSSISPSKYDENRLKEKGKKIVMDPKAALRKGLNIIEDFSIMAWNDSIVLILALKDKLHMFREIDNLDVLATIHMDTNLEQEQNDASMQTSRLLIQGLRHNGDISQQTEDAAMNSFKTSMKDLDKKLDSEYKKELEAVYTDLSAKNKERLAELLQKHRQQKQEAITATADLPEKERESLLKLIDKQQQMEDGELTFTLALEQNEEAEKLRKEFAIRKRMGIKEVQQNLMSDVISRGQLSTEKADWLLKEYKKQQEAVHCMYDEEISRQRMALEEKLARRRALAQSSEMQDDDHTDLLNLQATQVMSYFEKGRRSSLVTAEQSEDWVEELKTTALGLKAQMETAKETQEEELHKKLSQAKVTQTGDLMKKHNGEIQEFISLNKSKQLEGPVDPISYVNSLLKLKSRQRLELAGLENRLDEEHAQQLTAVRQQLAEDAVEKMDQLYQDTSHKMQSEGMPEKAVAALMKKHDTEMQVLRLSQEKNRRKQADKLKEELARRRQEFANRREKERQEQEDLREHEAEIIEKLVNSQFSMSEAERDRIMKEHEKQMVLLENSLTLNKLRQQHSLEERLKQKRAQQMSRLQAQQKAELIKRNRAADNNGEDDEERHQAAVDLMKKHAQQRIAIMQGEQLNIDDELEEVRIEMTKARALALKSQEERLGAMITALQMEKAREMTQIQEQQNAINNLKANLMDDLNERGILSTPECEQILGIHKQESEVLQQRMEAQREKQEKMLRAKLQERMQQREHVLLAQHEAEMRRLMGSSNKFAAKVRRVMLIHRHMVIMEKFRNRLDREVSQTLAHTRQQFEVFKIRKIQEEELSFVAGLVKVGGFTQGELLDVLHMLFPGKTEEDIQNILARIMEDGLQSPEKQAKQQGQKKSSIVERIYQALFVRPFRLNRTNSVRSSEGSMKRKTLNKKGSRSSLLQTGTAIGTIRETPDSRFNGNPYPTSSADRAFAARENSRRRSSLGDNTAGFDRFSHHEDSRDGPDYGQGMDFIAMGASLTYGDRGSPHMAGRLPPLQDPEQSHRGLKKKKKRGLRALMNTAGSGDV